MKRRFSIVLLCLGLAAAASAQTAPSSGRLLLENMLTDAVSKMHTDPSAALKQLQWLDRKYPGEDAVKYYLGLMSWYSGDNAKAEEYLTAAAALDSSNYWYRDALANIYAAEGRNAQSAEIYLGLLEEYPSRYSGAYTYTLLGDRYLSQYQDSLARDAYDRALAYDPAYTPAVIGRAEANRMAGNIPAFFADAHTFVLDPSVKASAKCDYVSQLFKFVDYRFYRTWGAQLDTLVNSCVRTHPADSSALRLAGSWYYSTDRKPEGRAYFDRLLEVYPEDLDAHYIRLSLLMDEGNMKDVLDECEVIISIGGEKNPEVLPALSTAGDCWHAIGNDRKAMRLYDKVLRIDSGNVLTLNNYAYYLSLAHKKLRKAEKMSRITIEKEPDNPSYLDTYGWILHLQGRDAEAKPFFKKAMVYGGKDHLEILEHYAVVLEALGDKDTAAYYRHLAETKKAGQ